MELIYSSGQNRRLMQIAYDAGYLLGVRSDLDDYGFPISFVDIEYRQPDFALHLATVKRLRPKYATVPDLSEIATSEQDVARAVKQAEMLGAYCAIPLIIPKRSDQLALIPAHYAIAYSVPTSYGGASFGIWKLAGRRVHLLGGSPHEQMKLYQAFPDEVQSTDGNMAQLLAIKRAKYWQGKRWHKHPESGKGISDLYLDCWQRSCGNIHAYWRQIAK